ncbi:hypothetical protein GEV33_009954 [Tenebrio molitor]|uniref:Uncharacterized protein n=1 Tax=Tenebrio molitor TaxID=7067 RepID=A0A8J6HEV2_TENMO|nr:hypothetical protein GEV33_009954 [Tenebrio molitor]
MEVGCRLILWPWRSSSVETAGGLCTPNCTRGYYRRRQWFEPLIMLEARGRNPPGGAKGLRGTFPDHPRPFHLTFTDIHNNIYTPMGALPDGTRTRADFAVVIEGVLTLPSTTLPSAPRRHTHTSMARRRFLPWKKFSPEGKSLCREIRRAKLQSLLCDISTTIASFWSTNTELVNPFEWPKMRTIVHANFKFIEIPLGISHNLSGEKFGFGQIDNRQLSPSVRRYHQDVSSYVFLPSTFHLAKSLRDHWTTIIHKDPDIILKLSSLNLVGNFSEKRCPSDEDASPFSNDRMIQQVDQQLEQSLNFGIFFGLSTAVSFKYATCRFVLGIPITLAAVLTNANDGYPVLMHLTHLHPG